MLLSEISPISFLRSSDDEPILPLARDLILLILTMPGDLLVNVTDERLATIRYIRKKPSLAALSSGLMIFVIALKRKPK